MKTVTRRGFAGTWLLLAGALVAGCISPTLPPFPPPSEPQTMTFVAPGQLRLQGVLNEERATVFALNPETGHIAGKLIRDGKYEFTIAAQPEQELELFYQVGREVSDSTFFRAPKLASGESGTSSASTSTTGASPLSNEPSSPPETDTEPSVEGLDAGVEPDADAGRDAVTE